MITEKGSPCENFRGPLFVGLMTGTLLKIVFGILGAAVLASDSLNDQLDSLKATPLLFIAFQMVLMLIVIMPDISSNNIQVKNSLYYADFCEEYISYMWALILPWLLGTLLKSPKIITLVINWTGIVLCVPLFFIVPVFLWVAFAREG